MQKLIIIFFMVLSTQLSFAESENGCDRAGKLTEKLGLEENQVEAVQQVMSEQKEKRRDLFQANRDSMKEQMDGLHNETKDKLSSVLSPEQMAKFEELHAERMEKREQRREKRMEHFKKTSQDIDSI
jgi:Spy/CpxP family protein refolding chaperone